MTKEIDVSNVQDFLKALHCHIRWDIIEVLKDGPKSSDEIHQALQIENFVHTTKSEICRNQCNADLYKDLKKHSLYYHLRELEKVGIISLDEFKPSESGRAPEKVWKLNLEKLVIKF